MISVNNLVRSFGSKTILNRVSFEVPEGEVFSLIGPNGAGKTTTMRCLYGDLKPDSGNISIFGEKFSAKLKTNIAVMSEDRLTFKRFKGEDYFKLWKMLYPNFDEEVFSNFILHYRYDLNQKVSTMSMGQKTLFHLALTISSGADLLILDEPTQNLDPVIRHEILDIIRNFAIDRNKTIIISSHEIYELEEISTSFAIIKEGKVLYSDTIDDAKSKHRIINKGETVPNGKVVANINEEILIETDEDVGRYATFKEISLAYLKENKGFSPF
ncbi:ABC transporter ATP-binding protein [Oceanotoga sp. DSM 15011]|jgi:ABC-2 type transport system ATP-binding protein|uniref:ABC-2 type transport system ATP-binding protein n=1 Tax=Oceanotoga teriensis TaxID=515440 RepID=A0AA45C7S2_9BACT|nr:MULTISPECIES: ABC transporter ATP-binding protein [Oceanotoga]MDN5343401.1 type transport system ATP-binding protein [Oceanotoga sp.]MDO7976294.1 ABC transporter ATP-binding protein [Oceanotoga teriensis]PWJ95491.1 ABC-2 type transport system ATP-binding protein [Oceanotoga teriensis]UYP01130.1 ABC transporter ATP-binding protein [Oceanotoga sp. DSM 15011]